MKNIKTVLLILFAIIIVILIFFLVKNIKNNNNVSQNDKIISEINYIDNKITKILNSLNNIKIENYKLLATKTSTNKENKSNSSEETPEIYRIDNEGILNNNTDIDWENIKNEVEVLYTIVPTITLDLYNLNINQEEILNFNKELDDLTIAVKNEDKEKTLIKLANLYRYLPAYASGVSNNLNYINILETKSNIFKVYVFVNINNWEEASIYTGKAIESYSRTLSNIESSNYDTNKIYIILNEIQNAVNIKDKEIFFIKYRGFVEETEKLGF